MNTHIGLGFATVSCSSASSCAAVGEKGWRPAVETRTASGWTERAPAAPPRGGEETLLSGVQCCTARSCVAAGTACSQRYPDAGLPFVEQRS